MKTIGGDIQKKLEVYNHNKKEIDSIKQKETLTEYDNRYLASVEPVQDGLIDEMAKLDSTVKRCNKTLQAGGAVEDAYYQKYMKYKTKYLQLKRS